MNRLATLLLLALFLTSCSGKEASTPAVSQSSPAAASTAPAVPPPTPAMPAAETVSSEPSLVSFASGTLIVSRPAEYGGGWTAQGLIDERADTGWASPKDVVTPHTAVFALPERTELTRLEFDAAEVDGDGRGAKDVTVEVSDVSATAGFQQILKASLKDRADRQSFPVTATLPGRWVRLGILNNQGSPEYVELMDFRGYGRQISKSPFPDASGTYDTSYGLFHLKQEGTSVTGCYEFAGGLLNGGIEGRVMKFSWRESSTHGPALMVFSSDGKQLFGVWGRGDGPVPMNNVWDGKKVSSEVGKCDHWSGKGGAQERMTSELEEFGRTRVYGINFDTGSRVLRDESKPTLDKIVSLMKAKEDWSLAIEGHTDTTGGAAFNQQLSDQRAVAVKDYLVTAGIAQTRLTSKGFGISVPIGDNATAAGRAQNRRVELAKK
ncbi:MAG: OmpA family protein [Thermoanaerobaculia bacterium]